jgi:drug/metabolite transporter (DMT)-like permease
MKLLTIFCIIVAVATWVAMSELLQGVQKQYSKPFFLAWLIRCSYMLCGLMLIPLQAQRPPEDPGIMDRLRCIATKVRVKSWWIASGVSWMAYAAGITYYWSLQGTSVPTNTALFQLNCVFVFLISIVALGERLTWKKSGAVLLCCAGTASVILSSASGPSAAGTKDTTVGVLATLLATFTYAVFECSYELFTDFLYQNGLRPDPKVKVHDK